MVRFLTLLAAFGWAAAAQAAPPTLTSLFPAGGQRGTEFSVTASGEFSSWPVQAWVDRPGVQVTADKDKGKLRVAVAQDAAPGVYWVRLYNADGATGLRPLIVDQLAEAEEKEPNNAPPEAHDLPSGAIVNGRLAKSGDVDGFTLPLAKGQTVVASLQANTLLGSPMDAVLQVCQLTERRASSVLNEPPQLEAYVVAQNHDARGLDPQVTYTAPRDGKYLVRVFAFPSEPNSTIGFAGAETYIYRLTLATAGFVDHALPLAASAAEKTTVRLAGWNIAADAIAAIEPGEPSSMAWAFAPGAAGFCNVPRIELPVVVASDEARSAAGQSVNVPAVVSGRLENQGEAHAFRFAAKKGAAVQLALESRKLMFPLDGVLSVLDAEGKQVSRVDDAQRNQIDPTVSFTPPADGEYRVVVSDLYRRGGPRFAYRLTMGPATPDFSLSLAADSFVLTADKPLEVPVTVERQAGYSGAIELAVENLPAGVIAEPVSSVAKTDTEKAVKLVLKLAPEATKPLDGAIRIVGRADGKTRAATFEVKLPGAERHWAAWLSAR